MYEIPNKIILLICIIACSRNVDQLETSNPIPHNNVDEIGSLFTIFDGVNISSDSNYFYISSDGLPDHEMMTGITNWQQQIPINQNYINSNSWSIPIKPEFSDSPLPSNGNFMKGALAVAVNGVPIFNPLNNRGEDANIIGELDNWGGHCGKADDYHYHIPPIHLEQIVGKGKPIAYSLDGFPLYGNTNKSLDENLGVLNEDGSYHYFTINEYPYFMPNVVGMVKTSGVSPENQIEPQAAAKAIRPALDPLKGAEITEFIKIDDNSYRLIYTLDIDKYTIDYNWDNSGHYYLTFTDPDGNTRTEIYHK